MKNTELKIYEIPQLELILASCNDILTLSSGFDGEEDDFWFK